MVACDFVAFLGDKLSRLVPKDASTPSAKCSAASVRNTALR